METPEAEIVASSFGQGIIKVLKRCKKFQVLPHQLLLQILGPCADDNLFTRQHCRNEVSKGLTRSRACFNNEDAPFFYNLEQAPIISA